MGKNIRKKGLSLIISIVICILTVISVAPVKEAKAASKYIKVEEFIKYLLTEMKLPVDTSGETPYIDAALKVGIVKTGEFKSYSDYLTRTDCAVLANRADKHINGAYYGYTKEVYEFLKDCTYINGFLFYDIDGSLYQEGKPSGKYDASQFLNDVVSPILNPYFKENLFAAYWIETSEDKYVQIGLCQPEDSELSGGIDSFKGSEYLIQAWQKIIDGDRKVQAVYDERISDLNKVTKSKRQDVAEAAAKGIIKGYSNGKYIQNRSFKGSSKITASGAKGVVTMVLDSSKRALISPDGQLIRTTKLPKNASEYPYILECFPNAFYEMGFQFQVGSSTWEEWMDRSNYSYPNEVSNKSIEYVYSHFIDPGMKPYKFYDTTMEKAKQYVSNVFDVDYRTVDDEWIERTADTYIPFGGASINKRIDRYILAMKKNHVVVESSIVSLEPSTLYYYNDSYYVRVYVKYRVTANTLKVEDDYELIFGGMTTTYLVGLENGKWTYGYYDLQVSATNLRDSSVMEFGADPSVGISDWALRGSK